MRNIKHSLKSLIVFMTILISCNSKEENKEETLILEAPYVRMKVDGKWWVSKQGLYDKKRYPQIFAVGIEGGGTFSFEGESNDLGEDFQFFAFRMPMPLEELKTGIDYSFTLTDETYGSDNQNLRHEFAFFNLNLIENLTTHASYLFKNEGGIIGESYPYTVRFTELEKVEETLTSGEKIYYYAASGKFSGKMINWKTKKVIEITEGEFKSKTIK